MLLLSGRMHIDHILYQEKNTNAKRQMCEFEPTRPAPKKGVRFEKNDPLNGLNLTRPAPKKGVQLERSVDKSIIPEVKKTKSDLINGSKYSYHKM